jgi:hypothetical protein
MAARVHRPLKAIIFHAGGGTMISVNSCKTYIQMWLCSQRHISEPTSGSSFQIITFIGLIASREENAFPITM